MLTFRHAPHRAQTPYLVSYTRPCPPVDPFVFLRGKSQRTYWAAGDTQCAGYGVAAEALGTGHERFRVVQQHLDDLFSTVISDTESAPIAPRVFGGFSFLPEAEVSGMWAAFPAAYFVLPRCLLTHTREGTWLTVNRVASDAPEDILLQAAREYETVLSTLLVQSDETHLTSAPRAVVYPVTREAWRTSVNTARQQIENGALHKVVLSRTCDVAFTVDVDPLYALTNLEQRFPNCYRFLVEPLPGHAFYGATPELIAEVRGAHLSTAALAGSQRRGATPEEDEAMAQALLTSGKDRFEHELVVRAIQTNLQPFAESLEVPRAPQLYRLSNIQHLYTPVKAVLKQDYGVLEILSALHPTPALGGYPQRPALNAIAQLEPIARGWYAAPVGWVDAEGSGTFAVAIRSAVSVESQARLYAGAGIVADSDPDKEWDETSLKFKPMLNALGIE